MKYNPKQLELSGLTFTTVYLGNYIAQDYTEEGGSHPGVDIVPLSKNAPVFAVRDGVVLVAKMNSSEGNYIVIQHDNCLVEGKNETLYSCYLHLEALKVEPGDQVTEGEIIGLTGNTGMSTGEHLHFQIDRASAPFHPYWPFSFSDAKNLGLGFMEAVNKGLGIDAAKKHTLNPLVWLDEQDSTHKSDTTTTPVTASARTTSNTPAPVSATTSTHTISVAHESASTGFSDVSKTHIYYMEIEKLRTAGISKGNGGNFFPDSKITRSEFAKIVVLSKKLPLSTDKNTHFQDVSMNSEFLPYINTLKERGILQGYADGTFGINNPVTRAEGLKILLKTFGIFCDIPNGPVYLDVQKNDWFAPFVQWSRDEEVLSVKNALFGPNVPLTRGEIARILSKLL